MAEELATIIRERIREQGSLTVEEFWDLCLAHPQYGYYVTHDPLGRQGDFITAPEISQLYGEMIGIWVAEQWQRLGAPSRLHLVECGPGRGTLMADILRIASVVPKCIGSLKIHLVEMSPALREKQKQTLLGHDVQWHDSFDTVPQDAPLIIIGNEFLDALPIRQFIREGQGVVERIIALGEDGDFVWSKKDCAFSIPVLGEGIFEHSATREAFMAAVVKRLKAQGGASLMIDYGHDVTALGDTFQAVKDHVYADVLENCGDADLTSHVDFGILKTNAERDGCIVHLQGQGDFLTRLGITLRAAHLAKNATDIQKLEIQMGLHRLVHPDGMGSLFRVMEVSV